MKSLINLMLESEPPKSYIPPNIQHIPKLSIDLFPLSIAPIFHSYTPMATASSTTSFFHTPSFFSTVKPSPSSPTILSSPATRSRGLPKIMASQPDIIGDFGARDPFPAELESKFGEKVLGNMNTEHKILIPHTSALSLSRQSCVQISPTDPPLSKDDAKELLFKLLGWRLLEDVTADGKTVLKLHCLWKLKDYESGVELKDRISKVADSAGHSPVLHQENNHVTAHLWTDQIGGLSINDFIVAAKIDEVHVSDLLPKKRYWA